MRAATTLTGFHFTVTALVGWISNATGYSVSKHVPLWELVWFSLVANTSITGMNLSLMLNSVGFYQVRTPCSALTAPAPAPTPPFSACVACVRVWLKLGFCRSPN
jgi:hypothetical protein